jgi:hypothetical protein
MHRPLALLVFPPLAVLAACGGTAQAPTPTAPRPPTTAPAPVSASPSIASSPVASPSVASSPSPATATALPPPSTPSPTAGAPATATPVTSVQTVWVGNTDGGGVFLRNSPHDGDRSDALPDGTPLTITGDEVEGDGQRWYPVRTREGVDGYVQVIYTTKSEPTGSPTPSGAPPK